MNFLKWLDEHFEESVVVICLIVLAVLTSLNVVLRYVFNSSLIWSEEACKLSLIISGFISIGYCVRKGIMIRVDALVQVLGGKVQKVMNALSSLLMLLFFSAAFYAGLNVVKGTYYSGQVSAALRIPVFIIYMVPVIGFALAVLRLLQRFALAVFHKNPSAKD